jgi:uncharacterized protein (DUF1499 family)
VAELVAVVSSLKPDNFTPKVVRKEGDYVYIEYESPLMGFVDVSESMSFNSLELIWVAYIRAHIEKNQSYSNNIALDWLLIIIFFN